MSYKGLFLCEDKVALVTGGAGLLGREIAKALNDFGAKVYIGDVDEKKSQGGFRRYRNRLCTS